MKGGWIVQLFSNWLRTHPEVRSSFPPPGQYHFRFKVHGRSAFKSHQNRTAQAPTSDGSFGGWVWIDLAPAQNLCFSATGWKPIRWGVGATELNIQGLWPRLCPRLQWWHCCEGRKQTNLNVSQVDRKGWKACILRRDWSFFPMFLWLFDLFHVFLLFLNVLNDFGWEPVKTCGHLHSSAIASTADSHPTARCSACCLELWLGHFGSTLCISWVLDDLLLRSWHVMKVFIHLYM